MNDFERCPRFFIDDDGQGFEVPCCCIRGTVEQCKSILYNDSIYKSGVLCNGNTNHCDLINELINEVVKGE